MTMDTRKLLLVVIAVATAGCGGTAAATSGTGGGNGGSDASTTHAKQPCPASEITWIHAERDLDARLDVGMTQADYSKEVGSVNVKFEAIPNHSIPPGNCNQALKHAFAAQHAYIVADQKWDHCITDYACAMSSVTPVLHAKWAKAHTAVTNAISEAGA